MTPKELSNSLRLHPTEHEPCGPKPQSWERWHFPVILVACSRVSYLLSVSHGVLLASLATSLALSCGISVKLPDGKSRTGRASGLSLLGPTPFLTLSFPLLREIVGQGRREGVGGEELNVSTFESQCRKDLGDHRSLLRPML